MTGSDRERELGRLDRLAEVDAELTHLEQHLETTRREGWEDAVQDRSAEYIEGALKFAGRLMKGREMKLAFRYLQKCEAMTRGQPVYFMSGRLRQALRTRVFAALDAFEKSRSTGRQPVDRPLTQTTRLQRITSQLVSPEDRPPRAASPKAAAFERLFNHRPRPKTSQPAAAAPHRTPRPPQHSAPPRPPGGGPPARQRGRVNKVVAAGAEKEKEAAPEATPRVAAGTGEGMDPSTRLKLLDDYQMPNMGGSDGGEEPSGSPTNQGSGASDEERSQLGQWKSQPPKRERKAPRRVRASPQRKPAQKPAMKKAAKPLSPRPPTSPHAPKSPLLQASPKSPRSPKRVAVDMDSMSPEGGRREAAGSPVRGEGGRVFDNRSGTRDDGERSAAAGSRDSGKGDRGPRRGPRGRGAVRSPLRKAAKPDIDSEALPPIRRGATPPSQSGAGAVAPPRGGRHRAAGLKQAETGRATPPTGRQTPATGERKPSPPKQKKNAKRKKRPANPFLVDNETLFSSLSGFDGGALVRQPLRRDSTSSGGGDLWLSEEKLRLQDKFLEARGMKRRQVLDTIGEVVVPHPDADDEVLEGHKPMYSAFARDHLPVEEHPPSAFKVPPPPKGNFPAKVRQYIEQQHALNDLLVKGPSASSKRKKASKEKKKDAASPPRRRKPKRGLLEHAKRDLEQRDARSEPDGLPSDGGEPDAATEGHPHDALLLTGIHGEEGGESEHLRAEDILAQMKADGNTERATPYPGSLDLPPAHYAATDRQSPSAAALSLEGPIGGDGASRAEEEEEEEEAEADDEGGWSVEEAEEEQAEPPGDEASRATSRRSLASRRRSTAVELLVASRRASATSVPGDDGASQSAADSASAAGAGLVLLAQSNPPGVDDAPTPPRKPRRRLTVDAALGMTLLKAAGCGLALLARSRKERRGRAASQASSAASRSTRRMWQRGSPPADSHVPPPPVLGNAPPTSSSTNTLLLLDTLCTDAASGGIRTLIAAAGAAPPPQPPPQRPSPPGSAAAAPASEPCTLFGGAAAASSAASGSPEVAVAVQDENDGGAEASAEEEDPPGSEPAVPPAAAAKVGLLTVETAVGYDERSSSGSPQSGPLDSPRQATRSLLEGSQCVASDDEDEAAQSPQSRPAMCAATVTPGGRRWGRAEREPTEEELMQEAVDRMCLNLCGAPILTQTDSQVLVGWVDGGRRLPQDEAAAALREERRLAFVRNRAARVIQRQVRAVRARWAERADAARATLEALFSVRNARAPPEAAMPAFSALTAPGEKALPPVEWGRTMKFFTPRPPMPPAAATRDAPVAPVTAIPAAAEGYLRLTHFSKTAPPLPMKP